MRYHTMDWAALWKEQYESNSRLKQFGDCASLWDSKERAQEFLIQSQENPERIQDVLKRLPITPESRILDIGSGPGTLAIPLTELAHTVTAVEPSAGMVSVMKEQATKQNVQNLSIVQKRWEEINPVTDLNGPFDIVIASYSLGMPDIETAIGKMQAVCDGKIWLFWFAGITPWERHMEYLWPKIHQQPYQNGPKSDILYNLLYNKGIYPHVSVLEMKYQKKYQSLEYAVSEMRRQIGCSDEFDPLIRRYYSRILRQEGDRVIDQGDTVRMCLWWDTNQYPRTTLAETSTESDD